MGLATAFYLSKSDIKVTILEKEKEIGGLSRSEEFIPGLLWDRFYHVILSTDEDLLKFVDEVGLSLDVKFSETKTGFYTDGQLHSMSNVMEFLRFKPLSLWSKFRLGVGILYSSRLSDNKRLEKIYAKNWLTHVFGRRNYEKLWDPLLRSKLGSAKADASASFIWATITRYYGTRKETSKKEMMGVVRGGYYSILANVKDKLLEQGSEILLNKDVCAVNEVEGGKIQLGCTNGENFEFDRVISTVPNVEILRLWPEIPKDKKQNLEKIRYLSLVCVSLVLKESLCPFYVTNITDDGFPFTGVIDATNVVPEEVLGGRGLIYLPRYMPPDDQFLKKSDDEIQNIFIKALQRIFPDFSHDQIITTKVNRESSVQPIQAVEYSKDVPTMNTELKNFFIVNTTMILNSTLNNNQVIQLARKMSDLVLKK